MIDFVKFFRLCKLALFFFCMLAAQLNAEKISILEKSLMEDSQKSETFPSEVVSSGTNSGNCWSETDESEVFEESECTHEPGLAYEFYETPEMPSLSSSVFSDIGCAPCCSTSCCYPLRFENDGQYGYECGLFGIWMPEAPALFKPLAADPREICYSLAWRSHDRALTFKCTHPHYRDLDIKGNNIIAVSYGDAFPIYRFFNVWPWGGQLQLDLQGALWAVFAPKHEYAPLLNADYYVAVPITYCAGSWSFRLRGYHISCHIGDEFMVLKPDFRRRNPSSEFIDFFVSYWHNEQIRLYGGVGCAVTQDRSFRCGRMFIEGGTEIRPKALFAYNSKNKFYSVPLFAMHFSFRDRHNRHVNATYILGYEWGKCSGLQRKARAFLEYHDGYSYEGQFCKRPTKYLSIKTTYGF